MKYIKSVLISCVALIAFSCCNNSEEPFVGDNFDRNAMLISWADDIIIPAFESYTSDLANLQNTFNSFTTNANELNYDALVTDWLKAYKSWQQVAIFDIGKAEEVQLRSYTNIYPSDVVLIELNVASQNYNLELPSNFDAQGFPALDYLIFGTGVSKTEIISKLSEPNYTTYTADIISRMLTLSTDVLEDWKEDYRSIFINNDGSSATASVDKLVNDFLFHYEKFFRAGKVAIPAGVFSGSPISVSVEASYSNIYSKELTEVAFEAIQKFFSGISFEDNTNGISLDDYLEFVMAQNGTVNLSESIQEQWRSAETKLVELSDSFKDQVENDNSKMLEFYDELQKAVILLKVDMLQAINIQVDFVDADGD